MKSKKRIALLEAKIEALERIVTSDSIILTDKANPSNAVVISLKNGNFSTDKVMKHETIENITNSNFLI